MSELYRKTSLERIANPEQLDRAITVSSPMSWLALLGVAVIFAAVLVWAFFGSLPKTVTVAGIAAHGENAWAVSSDYAGVLARYTVTQGAAVTAGTPIAELRLDNGETKTVCADIDGSVSFLFFDLSGDAPAQRVEVGTELARMTPNGGGTVALCYLPMTQAADVEPGRQPEVKISALRSTGETQTYRAQIAAKGSYAVNLENNRVFVSGLSYQAFGDVPTVALLCRFDGPAELAPGTLLQAEIKVGAVRPIDKLPIGKALGRGDAQ